MRAMFERIALLLKPDGRTFHHFITSRQLIPRFLDANNTLIGKYFPGGRIWPFDEIFKHNDYFDPVERWFVNGLNYWRTLDEWHRRFWENVSTIYPELLDEDGMRHWNEYFSLCKVCFAPVSGTLFGNGHYLFRKRGIAAR